MHREIISELMVLRNALHQELVPLENQNVMLLRFYITGGRQM